MFFLRPSQGCNVRITKANFERYRERFRFEGRTRNTIKKETAMSSKIEEDGGKRAREENTFYVLKQNTKTSAVGNKSRVAKMAKRHLLYLETLKATKSACNS